jgi:hypothetical protein
MCSLFAILLKMTQVTVILYCFSRLVSDPHHRPFSALIQIHKESDSTLLVQCIAVNTSLSVTISKGFVLYWF